MCKPSSCWFLLKFWARLIESREAQMPPRCPPYWGQWSLRQHSQPGSPRPPGGFADGLGPGEGPPPHPAARPNAMACHEAGRTPTASLLDFTENKPQTSDA